MISFICNHIVVTIYQDQLVYQYASTLHPLALAFLRFGMRKWVYEKSHRPCLDGSCVSQYPRP